MFDQRSWIPVTMLVLAGAMALGPARPAGATGCGDAYDSCKAVCSDRADACVARPGSYNDCTANYNRCMLRCEIRYFTCEDECSTCGIGGSTCPTICRDDFASVPVPTDVEQAASTPGDPCPIV